MHENANAAAAPTPLPRTLLILTASHALVDAYAGMIQPLWPDLQRRMALDDPAMQGAFVLWSLATSVSQFGFGYLGDRGRRRWWLWAGTAVGVVCLSGVGLARGFPGFAGLVVVGGLGIAAFHPEAAAAAGACAPEARSRAMSLFAVGGFLGQAAGPVYGGLVSARFGIPALAWGAPVGLALVAGLALAQRREPAGPESRTGEPPVSVADLLRGKGRGVALMMAVGILRVIPAIGVPLALAYLLKQRGDSNAVIGLAQSAFLGGVGAGSLGCALFVRPANERRVLLTSPLLSAPFLAACPWAGFAGMVVCAGVSGALLGVAMPILIGYGQNLLRGGQRVASSLTMGVTWGVGGVAVAGLMAAINHAQRPDLAFPVFAAAAGASTPFCLRLPHDGPAAAPGPGRPGSGRGVAGGPPSGYVSPQLSPESGSE